jgi:hypothetical protein
MGREDRDELLTYPLPAAGALIPPARSVRPRERRPVANVRLPTGPGAAPDVPRDRPPALELVVSEQESRPIEGLVVGGPREVTVRW